MANKPTRFKTGMGISEVSADPSSPIAGDLQLSDGTHRAAGLWRYDGSTWQPVGQNAGSLDIFYKEDFESTLVGDFTSGNNATFDNGGSLAGTLAYETSSPLSGENSLKYTQAGGSLNDWVKFPAHTLDDLQKGNRVVVSGYFTYDGDSDDIRLVYWDDTNNSHILGANAAFGASSSAKRFEFAGTIPSSCSITAVGFQVTTLNSGKILELDNVQVTTEPIRSQNIDNLTQPAKVYDQNTTSAANNQTTYMGYGQTDFDADSNFVNVGNSNTTTIANATRYLVPNKGKYSVKASLCLADGDWDNDERISVNIYKNTTRLDLDRMSAHGTPPDAHKSFQVNAIIDCDAGDYLTLGIFHNFGTSLTFMSDDDYGGVFQVHQIPDENSRNLNIISAVDPNVADSYIEDDTSVGYASTNSTIRRIETNRANVGSAITRATSSTLGNSYTINETGMYFIVYHEYRLSAGSTRFGITKNSTELSTNIQSLTNTVHRLAIGECNGSNPQDFSVSWSGLLEAGDVIRPHGDAGAASSTDRCKFYISKIGTAQLYASPGEQFQRKRLTSSITANNSDITDLKFNNLEIGKAYECSMNFRFSTTGTGNCRMQGNAVHDSAILARAAFRQASAASGDMVHSCPSFKFIATATTLSFSITDTTGSIRLEGSNSDAETWVELSELPAAQETTKWD